MLYVLYLSKGNNQNFLILVVFFTLTCICLYRIFLGPRGPLVLPSVGSFVRPVRPVRPARKMWITYIQAYMPYES